MKIGSMLVCQMVSEISLKHQTKKKKINPMKIHTYKSPDYNFVRVAIVFNKNVNSDFFFSFSLSLVIFSKTHKNETGLWITAAWKILPVSKLKWSILWVWIHLSNFLFRKCFLFVDSITYLNDGILWPTLTKSIEKKTKKKKNCTTDALTFHSDQIAF